jgi:hypothetical protein
MGEQSEETDTDSEQRGKRRKADGKLG